MKLYRCDLIRDLKIFDMGVMKYNNFKDIFLNVLNEHAPMKKNTLRGNNAPFMNKTLSKAFMHRSRLKNNYNKNPTGANKTLYKKQRNYCANRLCKEKRKYYNNLDLRIFEDNKIFWQRIKPLFSEKDKMFPKDIIIVENNTVTSNNAEAAEKLNNFFIEAVEKLDIEPFTCGNKDEIVPETIEEIIKKYEAHPSILMIKANVKIENKFIFKDTTTENVQKEILNLDTRKVSMENDIPASILAQNNDLISDYLRQIYNNAKNINKYPMSLKIADVIPVHKKDEKTLLKIVVQ